MSRIHVCPLAHVSTVLDEHGPGHVVSLLTPGHAVPRDLAGVDRHLHLAMSDIVEPRPGHQLPGAADVDRLLAFLGGWDRARPLLIHCYAGVSRSTAAAFLALCLLDPDRSEMDHALMLRQVSPAATPNPRLVALGDAVLARQGRMIAAVRVIGRGRECFEGDVFALDVAARRVKTATG